MTTITLKNKTMGLASRKGFTLIELLVVIAVIGILAAIALISLTGLQRSARDSNRQSNISDYATALGRYYQDNQAYPVSAGDVVGGPPSAPSPAATGIFATAGVLISTPSYIPKTLADPLGGNNCKPNPATNPAVACQYSYVGVAQAYTIWAVLEAPGGSTSSNSGIFYITSLGTRGHSPTGTDCSSGMAGGLSPTNCP